MVAVGDGVAGIVAAKPDLYGIPGVSPGGVVVLFFSQYGHTGHECKCLAEVGKLEFAV